ncbi:hypothetical protein Hanom_Chr03g00277521 [Helianthus anomalus]
MRECMLALMLIRFDVFIGFNFIMNLLIKIYIAFYIYLLFVMFCELILSGPKE